MTEATELVRVKEMQIWKFNLDITDRVEISMPKGAVRLSVALQHGRLALWALVDINAEITPRYFRIFGTGHPVEGDYLNFIGTVLTDGGSLVWHVFEDYS